MSLEQQRRNNNANEQREYKIQGAMSEEDTRGLAIIRASYKLIAFLIYFGATTPMTHTGSYFTIHVCMSFSANNMIFMEREVERLYNTLGLALRKLVLLPIAK